MLNKFLYTLSGLHVKYWRDILWQMSGNTAAQMIGIIGIPILSRIYTPAQFAEQSLFIQMITFLSGVVAFRLEYFIPLPQNQRDSYGLLVFTIKLGGILTFILTPIFLYFSEYISNLLGGGDGIKKWVWLCPICGFIITISIALQMYVQRQQLFKVTAIAEFLGKSSYVVSAIFGIFFSKSTYCLLLASVFSAIGKIVFLLRTIWVNRLIYLPSEIERNSDKSFIRQYSLSAFNLTFSHVLLSVTWFVPMAFINQHYGAEQLGQFSLVATTLYLPSGILGVAVGQVYYQKAAEIWNNGIPFLGLLIGTLKRIFLIGICCYLLVNFLAPLLYPLVFGLQWQQAGLIAQIMCISAFLSFVTSPFDKTSLIVSASWYPTFWASLRAGTTLMLPMLATYFQWDFIDFIWGLTGQLALMYTVDGCFSLMFSGRYKPQSDAKLFR